MLEKEVETPVVKYAQDKGVIAIKLNGPLDRGKPDRAFFYAGQTLVVEFKRPGCKPTPLQESWLIKFRDRGFQAEAIDSVGKGKTLIDQFITRSKAAEQLLERFDDCL